MNKRTASWGITSRSALFAIGVHLLLLALIGLSFNFGPKTVEPFTGTPAVQATVVTEAELEQEMSRLREAEQERLREEQRRQEELERVREEARELERQRKAEEERLRKLEQDRIAEEKRRVEAEKKRKIEEQKAAELEKQRKAEQERLKKIELEKQRKEEEQRQREETERKQREAEERERREQQARQEAERKKQEEAERKAREEAERRKREEAERKQREEEERRQAEEARIAAEMEREQTRQSAYSALQGMVSLIQQKVTRNWIRPPNTGLGLGVLISVRLTRSGEVISAKVAQSSGDERFDDSAVRAVLKASPLPFPNDPKYYEFISTFNFRFTPEG